jgi:uncharacterized membrane protein YfcA
MAYIAVSLAAFATAVLTLFSGFGLGTLLLPVFAIFFPLEIAVAATAVVHLANNLFKLGLLRKYAHRRTVVRFGVPAAVAAFAGAALLARLAHLAPLGTWSWGSSIHEITPLGLVLGGLIAVFAAIELLPVFERLSFGSRWISLGGLVSGFFGGLSGHQGALRAAFLTRSGLDRDGFLGTSVTCAVIVDCTRLLVYGITFYRGHLDALAGRDGRGLVLAAALAAFVGSYFGVRLARKVTLRTLQRCVGAGLVLLAIAIGAGLL